MRSKILLITARRANYLLPRKARLYLVSFFWENDLGAEGLLLFGCHEGIGHDDDNVSHSHFACCGTIEADDARARFATYDVGLEALTVVVINHLNLLAREDASGIHEQLVDGYAAHIVKVALGNLDVVDLRFHYLEEHDRQVEVGWLGK